jgi:methionyl-tRNA formyltransferase
MRILFLSGGFREDTLSHLLDAGVHVQALVVASGDRFLDRCRSVVDVAVRQGLSVHPVEQGGVGEIIAHYDSDVVVSCGFPYLLSKEELGHASCAINVHPSLLPKYRGYRSGPHVLLNGERESGVTVHYMTERMDAGDIISQESFPVSRFDTVRSVSRKCREIEPVVLVRALQQLREKNVKAVPQDEIQSSTYTVMRTPKDSEIDGRKPLCELFDSIRACDPDAYPAFFMVDGQKVCIRLWRPDKSVNEEDMI